MKNGKKLLCALLALLMTLTMLPAMAATTTLTVNLTGMYATSKGYYQPRIISGEFDVQLDGQTIATVQTGEKTALDVSGDVRLLPVAGSLPAEILADDAGYPARISEGEDNVVPVVVYADAGLFTVSAGEQASFLLKDAADETVLTFDTDDAGEYALPVAIPAGVYTLVMTEPENGWADKLMLIETYTGKESVTQVDADYVYVAPEEKAADVPAEPTQAPAAEAPVSTEAPTAEPTTEITALPTEEPTPEPTATATLAPTATPVPMGTLRIEATGAAGDVKCLVTAENGTETEAILPAQLRLVPGTYTVAAELPKHVYLADINGLPENAVDTYTWLAAVESGADSRYQLTLSELGSISGKIPGAGTLQLTGESTRYEWQVENAFTVVNVLPGTYAVSILLPDGEYAAEGCTLTNDENGTTASAYVAIQPGETVELPAIALIERGDVRGQVTDAEGRAIPGAEVTLADETGAAWHTQTDENGAWAVQGLLAGAYTVHYEAAKNQYIPGSTVHVAHQQVVNLTAAAAKPAKLTAFAFVDENNNGTQGKGEDGLAGVTMSLVAPDGSVADTGVTDKRGYVTLTAGEGQYILTITAPEAYGFGKQGREMRFTHSITDESGEITNSSAPITLSANGETEVGVGMQKLSVVTGTVWQDLNGDGLWQQDEPGIPNVPMTLKGVRNGMEYQALTDANGVYVFPRVLSGSYDLICHVPDEYVFTVKAKGDIETRSLMTTEADREGVERITVERSEDVCDLNIGMMAGLTIEGVCFIDANYNGVYDDGEPTLPGVELKLSRQSNNVLLKTAISDENGVYRFYGLRGSTFGIRALLPEGYTYTIAGDGENGNRFTSENGKRERKIGDIEVADAGHETVMLGAIRFGSISGTVYFDDDYSGDRSTGEKIDQGALVALYNAAGERVASMKTDKNGGYSFRELAPGSYTVHMTPERGHAFTTLGDGNIMANTEDGKGISIPLVLVNGEELTKQNIGMMVPAEVSGQVFADANDNGKMDRKEGGLNGARVVLMNEAGDVAEALITDDAAFTFRGLVPGTYALRYELPEGAVFSDVADGGNAITGDGPTAVGDWFTLAKGDKLTAPLCGGLRTARITGAAYADPNGNGVLDDGEPWQSGLVITLTPSRSDLSVITVTTGADGSFDLSGVRPDTYTLQVDCPDGAVLSRVHGISLGLKQGKNSQQVKLTVGMGDMWLDQYLGCVLPSEWHGTAYYDENDNGIHDPGEAPASGETVYLRDAKTGELLITAVTGEDGSFIMAGIAPGSYDLAYPLGVGLRTPKGGGTFHKDGDMMVTEAIDVWESSTYTGAELAIVRETSIGGKVWLQLENENLPLADVQVRLLTLGGALLDETRSQEDGAYRFDGLMPGDYLLDVVLPEGKLPVMNGDALLEAHGLTSVLHSEQGERAVSGVVTVKMAQHQLALDIGAVLPGRLGDKVWLDEDGNGLQDGDEGGIPGVTIELLRNGETVATTVSDQYGYYCFTGIFPTEYTLRVTWPEQVAPTAARTDVGLIVSVLQEDGATQPLLVPSDGYNYDADLGFVLVEKGVYPEGYGEGAKQDWNYKK